MNGRRRRFLSATCAVTAYGLPAFARANLSGPLIAFIDIETPGARAACEQFKGAIERRLPSEKNRPEVAFVPCELGGVSELVKQKLRHVLESLRPTIIVAANSQFATYTKEFNLGLPILFFYPANPIAIGYTDSLARPSKGMTGFIYSGSVPAKRREMLLRLAPHCRKLGIFDLEEAQSASDVSALPAAFEHVSKHYFYCNTVPELEAFSRELRARQVDAWDVPYGGLSFLHAEETVREFGRIGLPVIYGRMRLVRLGGMAAYEPSIEEAFDTWAGQCALILAGVPVTDIPIAQSTRYSFGLNLTALRNAGVRPPKSLIKAADVVIQ